MNQRKSLINNAIVNDHIWLLFYSLICLIQLRLICQFSGAQYPVFLLNFDSYLI